MFPSYLEVEKTGSQIFRAICREKKVTNTVAAIWREKKVDPCYLDKHCCNKKCSSQLLGARKKIMTSI